MRRIPLTRGRFAKVSDKDYSYLMQWNWYASTVPRTQYARTNVPGGVRRQTTLRMHRLIAIRMGLAPNIRVDHINGNGLDNRRRNLRTATSHQNNGNKRRALTNTSGYKGVHWHKKVQHWIARITVRGEQKHLGCFINRREAARAYNRAARKGFGRFARLNKV